MVLRGLGNAGYITDATEDVYACILDKTIPMEIRLSAIQALRRMPCDSGRVSNNTINYV